MSSKETVLAENNKQQKILKAASEIIAEKGLRESTITEIASKAGVVDSIIYHYFKNKEELLFEIMQLAGRDLFALLEDVIEKEKDPAECLKKMIRAHIVDWCLNRKKETKIIVTDYAYLTGKRKSLNFETERKLYSLYKKKFSEMSRKGLTVDADLTVLSFSLFGIIAQSIRWYRVSGTLSKEDVADNVIRILLHGILK